MKLIFHFIDSVAEWSKALHSNRSPQGHEFEPHRCYSLRSRSLHAVFSPAVLKLLRFCLRRNSSKIAPKCMKLAESTPFWMPNSFLNILASPQKFSRLFFAQVRNFPQLETNDFFTFFEKFVQLFWNATVGSSVGTAFDHGSNGTFSFVSVISTEEFFQTNGLKS